MKWLFWIVLALFAVGICFSLFRFFSDSTDADTDSADTSTVALVLPTLTNPFFVSMKTGAEDKAKNLNIELRVVSPVGGVQDVAGQIDLIETMLYTKPDAMCIVPADSAVQITSTVVCWQEDT